jgi:cytochrome c556
VATANRYNRLTNVWVGRLANMKNRIALCAVIMLTAVGVARADGLDPIPVRQAGMSLTGADFSYIRSVVAAKGDVKALEAPARALVKWAAVIPAVFPAGSNKGYDTKALPEIWSDRAGFEKDAAALGTAAEKLAVAAKAGDADTVAVAAKEIGDSCGACHRGYRAK